MKRNTYYAVMFISVLFLYSCGENKSEGAAENKKNYISVFTVKDGLIYKPGADKPYSGKVKSIIKDKRIDDKIIQYDVVNGIKEGEFKIFSSSDQIEINGNLVAGKNEGLWQYFYPNGEIESEGYFKDDIANGIWKWYYENGNLMEEGNYKEGKRIGAWKMYDSTGKFIKEEIFDSIKTDKKNIK